MNLYEHESCSWGPPVPHCLAFPHSLLPLVAFLSQLPWLPKASCPATWATKTRSLSWPPDNLSASLWPQHVPIHVPCWPGSFLRAGSLSKSLLLPSANIRVRACVQDKRSAMRLGRPLTEQVLVPSIVLRVSGCCLTKYSSQQPFESRYL